MLTSDFPLLPRLLLFVHVPKLGGEKRVATRFALPIWTIAPVRASAPIPCGLTASTLRSLLNLFNLS